MYLRIDVIQDNMPNNIIYVVPALYIIHSGCPTKHGSEEKEFQYRL